jgi:hypothetical protein
MQGIRRTGTIVAGVLALLIPVGLRAQSTSSGNDAVASALVQALADVETNRSLVIRDTVDRWRSQFRPADPSRNIQGGEAELTAALRAAPNEKLLAASQAQTYEEALAAVRGRWRGPSAIPLEPGVIPNILGDTGDDLVFTPITPCRIVDTRVATGGWAGKIGPGGAHPENWFSVNLANFTAQGGAASCPGMPTTFNPGAVALNVTSTGQTGAGNLRVVACGAAVPLVSLLNYVPGTNLANAAVVSSAVGTCTLGPPAGAGPNDIYVLSSNSASDVVIDIMGYFAPPVATAVQNVKVQAADISIAAGAISSVLSPACPAGYTITGGGGGFETASANTSVLWAQPFGGNGSPFSQYNCAGWNGSAVARSFTCSSVCARVPGR